MTFVISTLASGFYSKLILLFFNLPSNVLGLPLIKSCFAIVVFFFDKFLSSNRIGDEECIDGYKKCLHFHLDWDVLLDFFQRISAGHSCIVPSGDVE